MKILVVDDHPLIHQGLRQLMGALDEHLTPIAAYDSADAVRLAHEHPDCALILLDLAVPGASGLSLLVQLRKRHPKIPVVVYSACENEATVRAAMEHGAMGYISKTSTVQTLIDGLRKVLRGEVALPTRRTSSSERSPGAGAGAQSPHLSQRQLEVLNLILQGLPNKLICRRLQLAQGTVKIHVSAVLKALNVENRTQAVVAASRLGWLSASADGALRHPQAAI